MLGRVSFSGDGVAGLEKIVGGYYRCPARGRERGGPHKTLPHPAGVLAVCARVIGCASLVSSPHMPVLLLYIHPPAGKETFDHSLRGT